MYPLRQTDRLEAPLKRTIPTPKLCFLHQTGSRHRLNTRHLYRVMLSALSKRITSFVGMLLHQTRGTIPTHRLLRRRASHARPGAPPFKQILFFPGKSRRGSLRCLCFCVQEDIGGGSIRIRPRRPSPLPLLAFQRAIYKLESSQNSNIKMQTCNSLLGARDSSVFPFPLSPKPCGIYIVGMPSYSLKPSARFMFSSGLVSQSVRLWQSMGGEGRRAGRAGGMEGREEWKGGRNGRAGGMEGQGE